MINVDNTEVKNLFDKLKRQSKPIYDEAVRVYTMKMAYETKRKADRIIKSRFNFKNISTSKRSKSNIKYTKKPKKIAGQWQTEIGAVGDIKGTSSRQIGAYWLGEQELGNEVKQKKFASQGLRSSLMTRVVSGKMKPKQVKKFQKDSVETPATKMGLVIGIKKAKREGKKYVSSKWGVYQVNSGAYKPKQKNAFKIYNFTDTRIKRSKREWLKPAVKTLAPYNSKIAKHEIDRAYKKFAKP
jgi:hypothetical protein